MVTWILFFPSLISLNELTLFPSQLRGLVALRVATVSKRPVVEVLSFLENRIAVMRDESVICELIESLGSLRMAMESNNDAVEGLSPVDADSNTTSTSSEDDPLPKNEAIISDSDVSTRCDELLSLLSSRVTEMIKDMRAQSLRTILMLFSELPLQADKCVEAIEEEVERRRSLLEIATHRNADELLRQAASGALDTKRTLFGDDHSKDSKSPLAGLRDGVRSIFGRKDDNKNLDDEVAEASGTEGDEFALKVKETLQLIIDTASAVENTRESCRLPLEQSIVTAQQEALFELGRCIELIEQYRRIDFTSGYRRSRFDQERRRDMVKRVLSRKLP